MYMMKRTVRKANTTRIIFALLAVVALYSLFSCKYIKCDGVRRNGYNYVGVT